MTLVCPACDNQFTIYRCHIRGETSCCSRICSEKIKNRKRKTMITFQCNYCNKLVQKRKGKEGQSAFCSIKCMANDRGHKMKGPGHPNWKGGKSERSWESRKVIREKMKLCKNCEECGSSRSLQGHHVKEYSKYEDYRGDPGNIKILCVECHSRYHPGLETFILSKQ